MKVPLAIIKLVKLNLRAISKELIIKSKKVPMTKTDANPRKPRMNLGWSSFLSSNNLCEQPSVKNMPVKIIAVEVAMTSPLTIVGISTVWTEML